MEEQKDFDFYLNLINKEKSEEELFESIYPNKSKNYLINLNKLSESSFDMHKNICIGI
jgi:hypothetical protein